MRKMKKRLLIPSKVMSHIDYLLTHEPKDESECMGEDDSIIYTVVFGNGYEMDLKICVQLWLNN